MKGIEPSTFSLGSCHPTAQSTESTDTCKASESESSSRGSNGNAKTVIDAALQGIIDAWEDLPESIRVGIIAMVNAARPGA